MLWWGGGGGACFTFYFFGGSDVFSDPLDGADERSHVGEVQFAADKVLQRLLLVAVRLPALPGLQVVDLSLKRLDR